MKIISVFCGSLSGGGAERNSINVVNKLSQKGYEVHLVLFTDIFQYKKSLINKNVKIINFNVKRGRFALLKLRKYFKENNITLVISMMRGSSILIAIASIFLNKKFKTFFREANPYNFLEGHSKLKILMMFLIMKFTYSFTDLLIANSHQTLKSVKQFTKLKLKNSLVIYNPVIEDKFNHLNVKLANHKWIKDPKIKVLLGAGRLHKQKDFSTLIKAFNLLQKEDLNLRLIIIGDGEEKEKLLSLLRKLGISDKVDLKGFVDNPFEYMKGCDLFCLSSIYEGFGNVIVESMSLATKVVVTNCPGGPLEIIEYGKHGGIAKVKDHKSLKQAIYKELNNPRDLESLLEKSKEFSVSNFIIKI